MWLLKLVLRVIAVAFSIWLTTLIVAGVKVHSYENSVIGTLLTYLMVGAIFAVVNFLVGGFIRIVAFPIYILTLGLLSFIVNGFLLWVVSWLSDRIGFGLHVGGFWWAVLGAIVLGIFAWIIGLVLRTKVR